MYETERLVLRAFDLDTDLDIIIRWGNDAEYMTLQSSGPQMPATRESSKEFLTAHITKSKLPFFMVCEKPAVWPVQLNPEEEYFKAHVKACGPPIGTIGLQDSPFDFKNRVAGLGIGLADRKHRAKGYGTELMNWMLEYGFMELGLHRIELRVYSFNEKAIKLYRKIGFKEEGRLRKTYFRGGQWYDIILMAVLEEEWFDIRKGLKGQDEQAEPGATAILPDAKPILS
ncbi:hypothetical protein BAUCODRAFT_152703 [Baudoinia panamericana UAMH 10762]|uniref:N-acetyltransferase domain-containing protein n=1 Tax=Baudoinia panamericana (strain UAMH 10762) TaxID=717646 RepID=M2MXP7_BAUPA|nr:uncharacterized protein BAUCODRAFT_152703 [Baudoinia panamericana UAMH 10762]EMC91444.1 hypothetical protein BAUCODRAFT_152703 [Baudoinia panamericana UAMH 10762]